MNNATDALKEIVTNPVGMVVIGLVLYMIYLYIKHKWDEGQEDREARRAAKGASKEKHAMDIRLKYWNKKLREKHNAEHMSDKEFEQFLRKKAGEKRRAGEEAQEATERQGRVDEMQEALKSLPPVRYSLDGMGCRNCGAPLSKPTCDFCGTMHRLVKSELKEGSA